jgi:8-oxo-dGTP pyrophosphatase MutT (NUDIX family)
VLAGADGGVRRVAENPVLTGSTGKPRDHGGGPDPAAHRFERLDHLLAGRGVPPRLNAASVPAHVLDSTVPVEPRPAASVLLLRPGITGPIEVFLIRRARAMRFLGGYYAFPGGKVDLADQSHEALARTSGLSREAAAAAIGDPLDEVPALAYWLAGVREVFEETGVLLARDREGRPLATGAPAVTRRLEDHRRAIVLGERSFTAVLVSEGWFADLAPLAYLACFVTPPASPIRFSARFFLCPVPGGQEPRLIAEEASEGFWVDPAEAHRRFRAGAWPMAEPAEYGTQYLAQFETYEAVWRHHADGRPKFHGIIDRLDAARYYLFDWSTVVRPA